MNAYEWYRFRMMLLGVAAYAIVALAGITVFAALAAWGIGLEW